MSYKPKPISIEQLALARTGAFHLAECIRQGYAILGSGSPEALEKSGWLVQLEQAVMLLDAVLSRLADLRDDGVSFPACVRRIATGTKRGGGRHE